MDRLLWAWSHRFATAAWSVASVSARLRSATAPSSAQMMAPPPASDEPPEVAASTKLSAYLPLHTRDGAEWACRAGALSPAGSPAGRFLDHLEAYLVRCWPRPDGRRPVRWGAAVGAVRRFLPRDPLAAFPNSERHPGVARLSCLPSTYPPQGGGSGKDLSHMGAADTFCDSLEGDGSQAGERRWDTAETLSVLLSQHVTALERLDATRHPAEDVEEVFVCPRRSLSAAVPDGETAQSVSQEKQQRHCLEALLVNVMLSAAGWGHPRFLWGGSEGTSMGDDGRLPGLGAYSPSGTPLRAGAQKLLWPTSQCPSVQPSEGSMSSATIFRFDPPCGPTAQSSHRPEGWERNPPTSVSPVARRRRPHLQAPPTMQGGGVLHACRLDSYLAAFATAQAQSLARCTSRLERSSGNDLNHRRRFVLYGNTHSLHPDALLAARLVGYEHIRLVPGVMATESDNLGFDIDSWRQMVAEDMGFGLLPSVVCAGVLCGPAQAALDPVSEVSDFCTRAGIWCHLDVDAAAISALSCEVASVFGAPSLLSVTGPLLERLRTACGDAMGRVDSVQLAVGPAWCREEYAGLASLMGPQAAAGLLSPDLSLLAVADTRKLWYTSTQLWQTPASQMSSAVYAAYTHATQRALVSSATGPLSMAVRPLSFHRLHAIALAIVLYRSAATADLSSPSGPGVVATAGDYYVMLHLMAALHALVVQDGQLEVLRQSLVAGRLVFRWRLRGDEATAQLCRHLQEESSHGTRPQKILQLRCSLVTLQRRPWVSWKVTVRGAEPPAAAAMELWALLKRCLEDVKLDNAAQEGRMLQELLHTHLPSTKLEIFSALTQPCAGSHTRSSRWEAAACFPAVRSLPVPMGVDTPGGRLLFSHPLLSACHILYFTGLTRAAREILREIVEDMFLQAGATMRLLGGIRLLALEMHELLASPPPPCPQMVCHRRNWNQKNKNNRNRLDCGPLCVWSADPYLAPLRVLLVPGRYGGSSHLLRSSALVTPFLLTFTTQQIHIIRCCERKRQRVRLTNKGAESQQFSTVRPSALKGGGTIPASYAATTNAQQLRNIHSEREGGAAAPLSSSSATPGAAAFDPIRNDPVLVVVEKSSYWPPPTLEELQQRTGIKLGSGNDDGFDLYDRREEEAEARKEKQLLAAHKERESCSIHAAGPKEHRGETRQLLLLQ
eukprot:gene7034-4987_t